MVLEDKNASKNEYLFNKTPPMIKLGISMPPGPPEATQMMKPNTLQIRNSEAHWKSATFGRSNAALKIRSVCDRFLKFPGSWNSWGFKLAGLSSR